MIYAILTVLLLFFVGLCGYLLRHQLLHKAVYLEVYSEKEILSKLKGEVVELKNIAHGNQVTITALSDANETLRNIVATKDQHIELYKVGEEKSKRDIEYQRDLLRRHHVMSNERVGELESTIRDLREALNVLKVRTGNLESDVELERIRADIYREQRRNPRRIEPSDPDYDFHQKLSLTLRSRSII